MRQIHLPIFKRHRIDTTVLTRSLEAPGTISAPLGTRGAVGDFFSQAPGIPTVEDIPYCWFAFLVPGFSLILGYTGIAIRKEKGDLPFYLRVIGEHPLGKNRVTPQSFKS